MAMAPVPQAVVMTGDGAISEARSPSCDPQSCRIQEVASEVLRLRLVQTQHRQLEAQLRSAAEKLQQLPLESMLHFRGYLEQGLRPGGGAGTLGGSISTGGVEPESLYGLMECLCAVCDRRVTPRRQEDLLIATRWLLQDPQALVEQLVALPAAPSNQSRRLAPFLLSCDSGWRGHLSEAGQCYETLRSWLSCYYQYSLISSQVQVVAEQLQQQERLLEELSKDTEGCTGGSGNGVLGRTGPWRQPSGVRRSSSAQSNSSTGSRSQTLSRDRSGAVALELRPSPRPGGSSLGRLSCSGPREALASSPLKVGPRSGERPMQRGVGRQGCTSSTSRSGPLGSPSPARSNSPVQRQQQPCQRREPRRGPAVAGHPLPQRRWNVWQWCLQTLLGRSCGCLR
mmetsp:Transcript_37839/g.114285  ORF Transcript_37839/g.114285 Transcript_37839/m.114285 type:complete len:397 (-) Transcript_37839:731-1921(-)